MNNDTPADAIKPCPFCGNDGSGPIEHSLHVVMSEHSWRDTGWTVQCDKCTATMGYSDSEDEAIDAWNTRTPSLAAQDGLRSLPTDDGVTDEMVERAAMVLHRIYTEEKVRRGASGMPTWEELRGDGEFYFKHQARAALEAALGATVSDGWEDIATNPPPANEVVLMCWYHGHWEVWEYETGCYESGQRIGGYSNVHFHGQATHWRPLPAPPSE